MNDAIYNALMALLTAAIPILVTFAVQALRKIAARAGIDMNDTQADQLRTICEEAIAFAEQKTKVAATPGSTPLTGAQKKALAVQFANQAAQAHGLSPAMTALIDSMIEALLGKALGGEPSL